MKAQEQFARFVRRCYRYPEQAARPASLASGSPLACGGQPKSKSFAPCGAANASPSTPPSRFAGGQLTIGMRLARANAEFTPATAHQARQAESMQ